MAVKTSDRMTVHASRCNSTSGCLLPPGFTPRPLACRGFTSLSHPGAPSARFICPDKNLRRHHHWIISLVGAGSMGAGIGRMHDPAILGAPDTGHPGSPLALNQQLNRGVANAGLFVF